MALDNDIQEWNLLLNPLLIRELQPTLNENVGSEKLFLY